MSYPMCSLGCNNRATPSARSETYGSNILSNIRSFINGVEYAAKGVASIFLLNSFMSCAIGEEYKWKEGVSILTHPL